jgi:hypothetical protein
MKPVQNLSRALTIIARAEAAEHFMHADVRAWGAPGECHQDVSRGEPYRMREMRKQVESEIRRPFRHVVKDAKRRGMELGSPKWQDFVSRVYTNTYPF